MLGRRARRPAVDTPDGPDPTARQRVTRRIAVVLVFAVSLVVLFAPADDVPSNLPPGSDKVVHVLLFAALAFTARRAGARTAWLVPALLAYAVGSELVQASAVLGRSSSAWDALADAVGVGVGLLAVRLRSRPGAPVR